MDDQISNRAKGKQRGKKRDKQKESIDEVERRGPALSAARSSARPATALCKIHRPACTFLRPADR